MDGDIIAAEELTPSKASRLLRSLYKQVNTDDEVEQIEECIKRLRREHCPIAFYDYYPTVGKTTRPSPPTVTTRNYSGSFTIEGSSPLTNANLQASDKTTVKVKFENGSLVEVEDDDD